MVTKSVDRTYVERATAWRVSSSAGGGDGDFSKCGYETDRVHDLASREVTCASYVMIDQPARTTA